jgi:hypothetical protein
MDVAQTHNEARESWATYRRAFSHRSAEIPELRIVPQLIDWIVERGLASSLYASSSLDNLVISNAANWQQRTQHLIVIPKKSTVELRLCKRGKLVENDEVGFDCLYEELGRLIPELL